MGLFPEPSRFGRSPYCTHVEEEDLRTFGIFVEETNDEKWKIGEEAPG